MKPERIIEIDEIARITVTVKGVKGKACLADTSPIIRGLSSTSKRAGRVVTTATCEMQQRETQREKLRE